MIFIVGKIKMSKGIELLLKYYQNDAKKNDVF